MGLLLSYHRDTMVRCTLHLSHPYRLYQHTRPIQPLFPTCLRTTKMLSPRLLHFTSQSPVPTFSLSHEYEWLCLPDRLPCSLPGATSVPWSLCFTRSKKQHCRHRSTDHMGYFTQRFLHISQKHGIKKTSLCILFTVCLPYLMEFSNSFTQRKCRKATDRGKITILK